ncbi:hypothetical protein ACVW0I_000745 [Bradyrhizobium sp. LM6.11]
MAGERPLIVAAGEQEVLRNVFADQDHRRRVHRNEFWRVAQEIVEADEEFRRKAETRVSRLAAQHLGAHEAIPARLDLRKRAERRALHGRNGLADLTQHALLLRFG